MYIISQIYGIKLKHLYKKNRMTFGSEPYVGQKLHLIKELNLINYIIYKIPHYFLLLDSFGHP